MTQRQSAFISSNNSCRLSVYPIKVSPHDENENVKKHEKEWKLQKKEWMTKGWRGKLICIASKTFSGFFSPSRTCVFCNQMIKTFFITLDGALQMQISPPPPLYDATEIKTLSNSKWNGKRILIDKLDLKFSFGKKSFICQEKMQITQLHNFDKTPKSSPHLLVCRRREIKSRAEVEVGGSWLAKRCEKGEKV